MEDRSALCDFRRRVQRYVPLFLRRKIPGADGELGKSESHGEYILVRGIDNLEQIYSLKEEEVEVLLDAVSTSNVLFTSGYASYLEVITAQKSVLEAELELANIKKGIFHSVIGLYKALGGGWSWR